jgi:hypothetical protein
MDLWLVRDKRRRVLAPATSIDEERIGSIRIDEPMQVQTTFVRTGPLHRWWRGLVGRVAEAIDVPHDALFQEIKFKAGLIAQIMPVFADGGKGGGVAIRLKSTAYPLMDDADYSHFIDIGLELLFRDYLPGIRSKERQKLIVEWAGRRPRMQPMPKLRG